MAKVGTAEYDVLISRSAVQRELSAASRQIEQGMGQSARQVEAEFKQSADEIGRSLGQSAKKAESEFARTAKAAVGAFALYKGGEALQGSVKAASDLAEQQSKVGVVFGDSAGKVLEFASNAEKGLGQSKRQALEAAGTFGNLFSSVGLAQEKSAEMSTTLTALGSDLASFNNVPVDQALNALRSGLVGETEPLKAFGINLNEATLKAEAMALGLSDGKAPLDANAKAQAAYALILEQSGTAQGDFARTSESLANQQKITAAETENTSAAFGENLVPAAKAVQTVIQGVLTVFNALPAGLQIATVGLVGLGTAFLLLAPKIAGIQALFGGAAASSGVAAAGIGSAAVATTALSTASTAGLTSVTALNSGLLVSGAAAETMAVGVGSAAAATTSLTAALGLAAAGLAVAFGLYKGFSDLLDSSVGSWEGAIDVAGALAATDAELAEAARNIDAVGSSQSQFETIGAQDINVLYAMRDAAAASGQSYESLDNAILAIEAGLDRGASRQAKYGDATADTAAVVAAAVPALVDYADALGKATKGAEDAVQTEIDLFAAQRKGVETREAITDAQTGLNTALAEAAGNSEAYRSALASIEDAERAETSAARDTLRAQEDLNQARRDAKETLEDLAFAAERSALSEERAVLALAKAKEDLADIQDDPRASDAEKASAELSVREADLALRESQDRQQDDAAALAEAQAKGIEGSDQVVAAKERVSSALQAQADAETRTAGAVEAAAEVLDEAKSKVTEASDKVTEAILNEADQQRIIAGLTGDSADANNAYIESLLISASLMDPNSAMRKNLLSYIEDLVRLNDELESITRIAITPEGTLSQSITAMEAQIRAQAPDSAIPSSGRVPAGDGPRGGRNLTVNTTNGPSAQQIADELAFGGN